MAIQGLPRWIISLVLFGLLYQQGTYGLVVSLGLLTIFTIQTAIGAKYQLVNFSRQANEFEFQFYKFDRLQTIKIPVGELKMNWKPILQHRKGWTLKFYWNNQFIFHQKNFDNWTIEMQQELFRNIVTEQGREPTVDEKIISNWK
ncbi:MAG: hypothetical protein RIC30_05025 [Marinoscillum sp.]|uniref:hypothetical protein n=1 Tax=Marinoscillum sp. TaxID=2024838 RepID=UPI0032FF36CA